MNRTSLTIGDDLQADFAPLRGKLDGIRQQVHQDLFHPAPIRVDRCDLAVKHRRNIDLFLVRHLPNERQARLAHRLHRDRADLQFYLARLDLGNVQDLIDQLQQMTTALLDIPQGTELSLVQRPIDLFLQGFGQTQNRIQRRTELVAHRRQELVLEARGTRQLCIGRAQLCRPLCHPLCQVCSLFLQGFLCTHTLHDLSLRLLIQRCVLDSARCRSSQGLQKRQVRPAKAIHTHI